MSLIVTEDVRAGVRLVRIARPRARNALNVQAVAQLGEAFAEAQRNRSVRAVVLTGQDGYFCVGSDIKEMSAQGLAPLIDPVRVEAWNRIQHFEKPVIAAVQGHALGAGFELALTADMIIADETALFGLPETKIGVMPGDGGTQRLVALTGKALALRMILTGDFIDAAAAHRAGIVTDLVETGRAVEAALEVAAKIAANAPIAVDMAKRAVYAALDAPLGAGLALENNAIRYLFQTEDLAEGMRAFVEKRPPRFKGR